MKSLLAIALTGTALAQGPLTPPPGADPAIGPVNALDGLGAPQAAMKTLHQVEPRVAIPGGGAFTISQSGSYYLAGNIGVAGGNGIVITANGVNLDLNGFSITSSAAPAAGTGILLGPVKNVAIRNGSIGGGFAGGVRRDPFPGPDQPLNIRVADLSVSDVTQDGINLSATDRNSHVERCMVTSSNPSAAGIIATVVKECSVTDGSITGRIVKDCSVTSNGTLGITADIAENCYASVNGTAISAKCLVNSYGLGNGNNDVVSAGVAHNVWATGGTGSGDAIQASVVGNSHGDHFGTGTGAGVNAPVIQASSGTSTAGYGINGNVLGLVKGDGSRGINIENGVVTASFGTSVLGDSGIRTNLSVVTGCKGSDTRNGIVNTGGVVSGSYGESTVGPSPTGIFGSLVTGSLGRSGDGTGSPKTGIFADVVTQSRGVSSGPGSKGINAFDLVQGVHGIGVTSVAAPVALKFHSN